MKRILLLCAVLLGAVSVAQAGIRFGIGIGVPLPGPVYIQPPPIVVPQTPNYPPPSVAPVVPPVVVAPYPGYYGWNPGWYPYGGWRHYRGWEPHYGWRGDRGWEGHRDGHHH